MTSTRSSRLRRRRGRQEPTRLVVPESSGNRFSELEAFADAGGLMLLDWQALVVESWMGVDASGMWSAKVCAEKVPRQNGKTEGTAAPRMGWGAFALNEQVLYTSHLQKTSTETFEGMAAFFDQRKFRKYIKAVRTAIGRESIEFKNGGRVKFLARTRNGGRGQHADLLVFDEDQELTDEQQASFLPCLAASPNPQRIYLGTPPDENAPGEVSRRIRDRALSEGGIAYAEWSVAEIGDVADRGRWYEANPSLGILIHESTVEAEMMDMAADKFARERLGWWAPVEKAVEHVIDAEAWALCETDEPPEPYVTCAGVKFGPDRATLAYCLRPSDGSPYVEWVDTRPLSEGVGWVAAWMDARRDKVAAVAIDGGSTAALTTRLADMGFPKRAVVVAGSRDMAKAVSMLTNAVAEHDLAHYRQDELTASATLTARRRIGSDGVGFEDAGGADSTLIEACALALWQAKTMKRRPGRKAVVY